MLLSRSHRQFSRFGRGLPLAAAILLACGHAGATDVPRGGAEIKVGAGSRQVVIKVKNTTGEAAKDITVGLEHGGGMKIRCVDVQGTTEDIVDDNGNGVIDRGETDTCIESASTVVKSILKEGEYADGSEQEVLIDFNGLTPEGAVLRIKFSKEIGGRHYDMASIAPLDPAGEGRALVSVGAAQVATGIVNVGTSEIRGLQFWIEPYFDPYMPPEVAIERPAEVWQVGRTMQIRFEEPVVPGEQVELGLEFRRPVLTPEETFEIVFAAPDVAGCYADCDGDGELSFFDFLCFQDAFASGLPAADCDGDGALNFFDFLCFQNAFAAGCQ